MSNQDMYNNVSPEELLQRLVDAVSDIQFCRAYIDDIAIKAIGYTDSVQMDNLALWCKALNIEYFREDWDGNESCKTNHDCIWFMIDGVKFFQLVSKEWKDDYR